MSGVRWSPEDYERWRKARPSAVARAPVESPPGPKYKSKAEARYAQLLEARRLAGEIADWEYEELTLVVGRSAGDVTRLTPDFVVHTLERNVIELHEVKGYLRDDARAKLLSAVKQWPEFRWRIAWSKRHEFHVEHLN